MQSRRELLRWFACASVTSTLGIITFGQKFTPLPKGIGVEADYAGPLPARAGKTLGDRPPRNSEERIAKAIITKAPTGPTPFDVANYFLGIATGQFGNTWQPYAQGWPVRWNPVIVNFFEATSTKPEGDLTAWCAAFVNWCFKRAANIEATMSASSGSFRTFGSATETPVRGDLAVFRRVDVDQTTDMHGHVCFFVADHGDCVEVLGGNQIERQELSHMVSVKCLAKKGKKLALHSYRTDPRLHVRGA
jgi:uncharacterized protein (TIGR02594 family)